MGCVYRATNVITGKYYIGKTKYSMEERRKSHYTEVPNTYFHKALRKYGRDNFEWDILFESDDEENLYKKERLFIRLFNTMIPYGYNMTTGGDGQYSREFSSFWRDSNMKRAVDMGVACYCVELNKIYKTGADAYRDTGVSTNTIRLLCKQPFRKATKYHFCNATEVEMRILQDAYMNNELQYGKHITEEGSHKISMGQKNRILSNEERYRLRDWIREHGNPMKGRKMSQESIQKIKDTKAKNGVDFRGDKNPSARAVINLTDGNIFRTMKDACVFYGLRPKAFSNISSACSGRIKTAYGYKWAYYNEDNKSLKEIPR